MLKGRKRPHPAHSSLARVAARNYVTVTPMKPVGACKASKSHLDKHPEGMLVSAIPNKARKGWCMCQVEYPFDLLASWRSYPFLRLQKTKCTCFP